MGLRARAVGALVALACVAVAGCGSSGRPPSALDPARVIPLNAIAYVELTVRPQGAQRDDVESALTKLLGHSPDADIQRVAESIFRGSGLRYQQDVEPWLGQRIAFVATAPSKAGVALIAPTDDPQAAAAALARGERRHGPFVTRSFAGVTYKVANEPGTPVAFGTVGHYAVIGGTSAFKQIVDAYRSTTYAPLRLPSGSLMNAYVNGPRAIAAIESLPTISAQARQQLRTTLGRAHLPAALSFSLSVSSHTLTADFRSLGPRASHASAGGADVKGLPGDSWLAISTGSSFARYFSAGFNAGFLQGFSRAARASGVSPTVLLGQFRQRTGIDLTRDLLPALGPFQFAMEGSSITALRAALALYPSDPAAGARLVGDLHNLAARAHSLRVIGGSRSFRFGPASLPFPIVGVADLGRKIIAKFALSNTHPATGKLSANPVFVRARAQLPAGSTVPLFLNFGPLAALLSETPQFKQGGSDHNALAVLRRLDYFAVGTSATTHDTRVVLGLH